MLCSPSMSSVSSGFSEANLTSRMNCISLLRWTKCAISRSKLRCWSFCKNSSAPTFLSAANKLLCPRHKSWFWSRQTTPPQAPSRQSATRFPNQLPTITAVTLTRCVSTAKACSMSLWIMWMHLFSLRKNQISASTTRLRLLCSQTSTNQSLWIIVRKFFKRCCQNGKSLERKYRQHLTHSLCSTHWSVLTTTC